MAKKKQRATQTSKGTHCQKKSWAAKAARKEWRAGPDRVYAQLMAFTKGKKVMLTIPNPNTNETNKRFIRVPAADVWKTVSRKR